ncbi:pyridoxal phosphate-dependent aminotransferase [Vallitalea guaymasensis]|uniref:Aminotransferase class I/II-fold pyridoxal phosphate-dependent enzyme n=1 Tax=Vallitalea guaymasensis TaxID=1185412 RepID=A0A8J8M8R6_9FIRM|nr:histidinol-phosphate transaminase [Vallitalea guaymasensis]QUH28379.1 aminotransferase class I/II-fold pyridoxal phosphate-dependent enzyme [Vallitalea guaymasensis]
MSNKKSHFHGSDLEKIESVYNINKYDIINFSGNVNPLGVSKNLLELLSKNVNVIGMYPDRAYTKLRKQLAKYIDVNYKNIIVGNGSTELISIFINIIKPTKALIVGPTYSEYEREISIGGGSSNYYPLKEELDFKIDIKDLLLNITDDMDLLVICNPNNPTSTSIYSEDIKCILEYCHEKNIYVMVDETYIEFTKEMDKITSVGLTNSYDNLFITRGVSKFYASPGLRLGYGICGNKTIMEKINNLKNPWTINSLASFAGEVMFEDEEYIKMTKDFIEQERNRIYKELDSWKDIKVYPPTANFILIKILRNDIDSHQLFETLIQKKIMIRDASTFPFLNSQFFRFCFMNKEQNDFILDELSKIFN